MNFAYQKNAELPSDKQNILQRSPCCLITDEHCCTTGIMTYSHAFANTVLSKSLCLQFLDVHIMSKEDILLSMRSLQELMSPHSGPEHLLLSASWHETSARSNLPTKHKMKAPSKSGSETILNHKQSGDASIHCQGAEVQPGGPGPVPEYENISIINALQGVFRDEVQSQVASSLEEILDMLEEAVEQLFCTFIHLAEKGICTVVLEAAEYAIPGYIRTTMVGKTIIE